MATDWRAVAGTRLLTLRAVDADLHDNGHVTYALAGTDPDDVISRSMFDLNSTTGELSLAASAVALDRETVSMYRLSVVAHDLGVPQLTSSVIVNVEILDINDNWPQIVVSTLTSDSHCHVTESADVGTFVALVSVTDADSHQNGNARCQLVPDHHFELVELQRSAKYKIVTATLLDREVRDEYQLNVTCTDLGQSPRVAVHDVTVTVDDVNDNAPYFLSDEYHFVVAENNAIGQSVGHVTAEDRDVGENARIDYVITGDLVSTVNFRVDVDTGVVRAVSVLDHESAHARDGFRFQIEARNSGDVAGSLTATANVTVVVSDLNDIAPRFDDRSYTFVTPENQPTGSVVGRVHAEDLEVGDFGIVRYSLKSASDAFDIDAITGAITTRRPLDRELFPVYRIAVVASNVGVQLITTADVTVYVADVNDNAPEIELPTVSETGQLPVYVSSGLERGRRATRIIARDSDAGDNATLTFYLRGDDSSFVVDPNTGVVFVDADLSGISERTFVYRVLVVDRGAPPLSSSASLTIVVNSSIAVPPLSVDDVRTTSGDVTANSSVARGHVALLSSTNFIVVVTVAAATVVIVIILVVAIIYVVCHRRQRSARSAATTNRHAYKPSQSDTLGSGSQENLSTAGLSTTTSDPTMSRPSHGNSFALLTASSFAADRRNGGDFGSFGKADEVCFFSVSLCSACMLSSLTFH